MWLRPEFWLAGLWQALLDCVRWGFLEELPLSQNSTTSWHAGELGIFRLWICKRNNFNWQKWKSGKRERISTKRLSLTGQFVLIPTTGNPGAWNLPSPSGPSKSFQCTVCQKNARSRILLNLFRTESPAGPIISQALLIGWPTKPPVTRKVRRWQRWMCCLLNISLIIHLCNRPYMGAVVCCRNLALPMEREFSRYLIIAKLDFIWSCWILMRHSATCRT